jgi:hypothetical protein
VTALLAIAFAGLGLTADSRTVVTLRFVSGDYALQTASVVLVPLGLRPIESLDGRIFTIPYLRSQPLSIGTSTVPGGVLELSIDPLQLVRVLVRSGSSDRGKSLIEVVESSSSFSCETTAAGELWLLLSPGAYIISEREPVGSEVSLKIDAPKPAELTIDLTRPE